MTQNDWIFHVPALRSWHASRQLASGVPTELEVANNAAVARAAATPATISDNLLPSSEEETQRLAAAVLEMPPDVRRFFGREDPPPPWQWESDEDRLIASRVFLVALCSEVNCGIRVDERVLDFQTERIVQTTCCQALEN